MWTRDLRKPAEAPRDGTRFMGIPKGRVEAVRMSWDPDMGCFLSEEYDLVDELASWYPVKDSDKA